MIKQLLLIIAISIVSEQLYCSSSDSVYSLTIQLKAYAGQNVELGYSYGSKILFKDQIKLDSEGRGQYSHIDHEGIYFLSMDDSSAFEFMITQSGYYNILSDNGKISIQGNTACETYQQYLFSVSRKLHLIDSLKRDSETSNDPIIMQTMRMKIANHRTAIDSITLEIANSYKGNLLGNYAKAMLPVKISGNSSSHNLTESDSISFLTSIYKFKQHYFDNITFSDTRLLYTPVIEDKINSYLDRMVYSSPDSLCQAIDILLLKSSEPEVTQFIASLLIQKFSQQKHREGSEHAYIHLVQDFYLAGKAPWLSTREIRLLSDEVQRMRPVLTGNAAPEIELFDATGRKCSLYAIQKELTIVLFWDFSCPNCKRILQDLINLVKKYNYLDLQVYSIYTGNDLDIWKAWNYKKLPATWINTYQDSDDPASIRFNIPYTPAIFILDKNKVIIKKNITVPQLDEYLFQYVN